MNYFQYLRVIWARRWLVLWSFLIVSAIGIGFSLTMLPKRYTAEATLVLDSKPDPTTNAGWQPGPDIATQLEILRSERVAERAIKLLELDKDADAQKLWERATEGKMPFEAFHAKLLQKSTTVEPARASNLLTITVSADTAAFAAKAANAMAQAYLDVSVDLRVAPARQYSTWFEQQSASLRADLERAQARLSKFQQDRRIVGTGNDDRFDDEMNKLNVLTSQLAAAQAERADAAGRLANSGSDSSLDVVSSPVVAGLRAELARNEARLSEISGIVGTNHPQRIGLESQIAELKRQIAAESRRVTNTTASISRAQAAKVGELQALVEQQRAKVLSMRGSRDEIAVLLKDVENAQRAYDSVRTKMSELALQSANQQAAARVLSPAVEPLAPKSKVPAGIGASLLAGIVVGIALAVFFEALDPRVRGIEDLSAVDGVPVIGVLQSKDAKAPSYRRFALGAPYEQRKLLPMAGGGGGGGAPGGAA